MSSVFRRAVIGLGDVAGRGAGGRGETLTVAAGLISGGALALDREKIRTAEPVASHDRRLDRDKKADGEGRTLSPRIRAGGQGTSLVSEEEVAVREYVARARLGDKSAFRMLVETYQQRIYAVAFGVIGNPQDAEDIVQDAFVKAYRKLDTFKGQSSFYTWIYRIAFNLSVDLSRKRYRHRELMFGDARGIEIGVGRVGDSSPASQTLLDRSSDPERDLHRSQLRSGIQEALRDLSPEHRAVITLREIEGLSYSEISDVIGVSKGTVMSRLHHARRKLQRALSQFLAPDEVNEDSSNVSVIAASTVKAI